MFVTGLVLAAGGSRRLGEPKQLLPYGDSTLLDSVLGTARECDFDQLIVTLGGAAGQVRDQVDLSGVEVVENTAFGTGCSSSIVTALAVVDPRSDGIVLMLGDQPGVTDATVRSLVGNARTAIAVSRYDDGRGHPFWFGREVFGDLAGLHGDKGVWKLIESGRHPVTEVRASGNIPLDVDDWDDYRALLAQGAKT
ncbi:molybdenum cofactor cytidylyltransferase [Kribbella orskensis]|uniref:Molybdenum cofactor cytidylyltransferase n=1 Tax=Kribbella orskensis TaxID=2512216 RepID=A0ABY2BTQ4_9ACTN|nr:MULTISPECIES: nucleotidyltransferase family protein [Kribbella]TCN44799.1 molybdenum cofactor cytidylyltransferase [Kribbella sp. VKM Ac-2500]TCO31423.1 molybdenum cofactor cytidylyltransferase [Kribbella orskensis]